MNVNITPPRIGPQPWEVVRSKLDQSLPFANMRETPYYRDCIWDQFSKKEYDRRYKDLAMRFKQNFGKFEDGTPVEIVEAGPKI